MIIRLLNYKFIMYEKNNENNNGFDTDNKMKKLGIILFIKKLKEHNHDKNEKLKYNSKHISNILTTEKK